MHEDRAPGADPALAETVRRLEQRLARIEAQLALPPSYTPTPL